MELRLEARQANEQQLFVQEPMADPHVGQKTAEAVDALAIERQTDRAADEELFRKLGGFGTEALDGVVGLDGFGRVDADQPHPVIGLDDDGVAVDDADHAKWPRRERLRG